MCIAVRLKVQHLAWLGALLPVFAPNHPPQCTVRRTGVGKFAYYTSAFYEYYRDDLFAIYDARPSTLWELNSQLTSYLLTKTGIAAELIPTTDFAPPTTEAPATFKADDDWRERIDPKKPDTVLRDLGLDRPYYQLFSSRCGFQSGLSVVDLLFNEWPDSISWIK